MTMKAERLTALQKLAAQPLSTHIAEWISECLDEIKECLTEKLDDIEELQALVKERTKEMDDAQSPAEIAEEQMETPDA